MSAPTFGPSQSLIRLAALFEGLSSGDLKRVLSRASWQTVPTGAFLFHQGEPATEMFLLESGKVRLNEVTVDGRELLIRFVRPGEVCGDKASFPGANYGASALSETPVRAYAWTTEMIAASLNDVPRLATNLFAIATRYLHYSRERYRLLATSSAESRMCWAVASLAHSIGISEGKSVVISGRALHRDIADLAATTIYTVSRVLSDYERRGVLIRKRGALVLFQIPNESTRII